MSAAGAIKPNDLIKASSFKVSIEGTPWEIFDRVSNIRLDVEDIPFQTEKSQMLNRPGRFSAGDITLYRLWKPDRALYAWIEKIKNGSDERKSGSITMLDDKNNEIQRLNFFGAWPKTWIVPELSKSSGGNDVLLEGIVLSVEDIELA